MPPCHHAVVAALTAPNKPNVHLHSSISIYQPMVHRSMHLLYEGIRCLAWPLASGHPLSHALCGYMLSSMSTGAYMVRVPAS